MLVSMNVATWCVHHGAIHTNLDFIHNNCYLLIIKRPLLILLCLPVSFSMRSCDDLKVGEAIIQIPKVGEEIIQILRYIPASRPSQCYWEIKWHMCNIDILKCDIWLLLFNWSIDNIYCKCTREARGTY